MKWIIFWTGDKAYESEHDLRSRINNLSGWKKAEKIQAWQAQNYKLFLSDEELPVKPPRTLSRPWVDQQAC